jgi:hypothetical protein
VWGRIEGEIANRRTQLDATDSEKEGKHADNESDHEEPSTSSERDFELPSPQLSISKNPDLKRRYDQLVQCGSLASEEIQVLETSAGDTLLTLLKHFELMAAKRTAGAKPEREAAITPYPYCAVHVLLLEWEEDDLGVNRVSSELKNVFENSFTFESVQSFKIPSQRSYEALEARLLVFKQLHSAKQHLLIVYYAGHGYLDLQNRMHWAAQR